MKILLTNKHLFVSEASPKLNDLIYNQLRVRVPNAFFTTAYKKKRWDGYKNFYNQKTGKCDAGFADIIIDLAGTIKEEVIIEDSRLHVGRSKIITGKEWDSLLRKAGIAPHGVLSQIQARVGKKGLKQALAPGIPWRRGIFEIATGGGKTSLAALLLKTIDRPAIFMVNKLNLLYQTKETFDEILGEENVGIIGDMQRDYDKKFVLLMLNTATILLDEGEDDDARETESLQFKSWLARRKVFILDEAHHLSTDTTYIQITEFLKRAYYRFALTATPLRRKDPGDAALVGAFGLPIVTINSKSLRDKGILADVKVWVYENNKNPLPKKLDTNQCKSQGIYRSEERNIAIVECAERFRKKKWPCLILVDTPLVHGHHVQETFKMLGKGEVPIVNFQTSAKDRKILLTGLEEGVYPYIIASVGVFGEGVDAPSIRALIRAEAGSSEIRTLQAAGRGMRRKPSPNVLHLCDFWDQTHKTLEKNSRKRIAIYEEEQYCIEYISSAQEINFS